MTAPVWYACYGSNLALGRFRVYLEGGVRTKGSIEDPPCGAGAAIADHKPYMINRQLYFAGESSKWDGGAVAFLGTEPTEFPVTYGRIFLLSFGQFRHVVQQENGGKPATIDYASTRTRTTVSAGWYSELIPLGSVDGIPVMTLTAPPGRVDRPKKRSEAYVRTILAGLAETFPWPILPLASAAAYIEEALSRSGLP